MVLNRTLLALALVLAAGCAKRVPPQRLANAADLSCVLVVDPEAQGEPEEGPAGLEARLAESVLTRNLTLVRAPLAAFAGQKISGERVKAHGRGNTAAYRLVVETRAVFFSQLAGSYRWSVGVRLSATRQADGAQAVEEFSLPAVLQYDHQKGPAAVEAVADEISRRAALALDGLIAAPANPAAATARPSSIYFVMVDRFANGDRSNDRDVDLQDPQAFHGGDLAGLTARLDWLKALGVDTVWLSPVFTMRRAKYGPHGAFHGYWVEDLNSIEPALGGEAALKALAAGLHARGMKLVLDVVLNHAAPDGALVKAHPDWFHGQGGIVDWNDAQQLVNRDVHGLPDFAEDKPQVYAYLVNGTVRWLGPGLADGLRLDAVKHMPKSFWKRFVADVKGMAGQKVFVVAEELEGDPPALDAAWRGGGFDAVFDFPLAFALTDVFCRAAAPERLASVLANDRLYPDPAALVTLLDNHDLPRIASSCGGDEAKVSAALTFLLTARGIPSLIWGTEEGLTGEKEPFNRVDMRFDETALTQKVRALLQARRAHPALSSGADEVLEAGARFLAISRVAPTERAVIAVNGSKVPRTVKLAGSGWVEVGSGGAADGEVAPGTVRVWTRRGDFAQEAARAEAQWRTGARKRPVIFELPAGAKVSGSGPELGAWKTEHAVTQALLPVGSVFEFKVVRSAASGAEWEPGENRVLFVADGEGTLAVKPQVL